MADKYRIKERGAVITAQIKFMGLFWTTIENAYSYPIHFKTVSEAERFIQTYKEKPKTIYHEVT